MTHIDIAAQPREACELINQELILATARKHGAGDDRERCMITEAFFWSLVLSVGDKVHHGFYPAMASVFRKLYGNDITKGGIKKQMKRRDWHWFKDIYEELLQECLPKLDAMEYDFLGRFTDVRAVDSTVIEIVKKLGGKFRATTKGLAALKVHTLFSVKHFVALKVGVTDQCSADINFSFLSREKGVLYVFDLGYWCYGLLTDIMKRKSFFVSRLKEGADVTIEKFLCRGYSAFDGHKKKLMELISSGNLGGELFDAIVQLGDMKERLRLVGLKHDDEWYFYVTNLTDFTPQVIYETYRLRWQIELFFKDLKSGVSLRDITTRTENAIMLEIYAVLIFHLLTRMLMSEAVAKKPVRLSVRKSLAMVKRRLADVVLPMLLGRVRRFRAELRSLLASLLAQCEPG